MYLQTNSNTEEQTHQKKKKQSVYKTQCREHLKEQHQFLKLVFLIYHTNKISTEFYVKKITTKMILTLKL